MTGKIFRLALVEQMSEGTGKGKSEVVITSEHPSTFRRNARDNDERVVQLVPLSRGCDADSLALLEQLGVVSTNGHFTRTISLLLTQAFDVGQRRALKEKKLTAIQK